MNNLEQKLLKIKEMLDKNVISLQETGDIESVYETQLVDKQFGQHGLVYTYRIAIKSK